MLCSCVVKVGDSAVVDGGILNCNTGRVNAHRAMLAPLSPLLDNLFNIASQIQAADTIFISLAEVDIIFTHFNQPTFHSCFGKSRVLS